MVMAEDPAVRETRLALLKSVNDLLARFADFRLVATTESPHPSLPRKGGG
jgi:glycyl-tRNA synthetase beta subunit